MIGEGEDRGIAANSNTVGRRSIYFCSDPAISLEAFSLVIASEAKQYPCDLPVKISRTILQNL